MGLREFEHLLHSHPRYGKLEAEAWHTFNRWFMISRTAGIFVFGVLILIVPMAIHPTARALIAGFLCLVMAPADLAMQKRLRGRDLELVHTAGDVFVVCAVVTLAPVIWGAGMVVVTGVLVAAIPMQSRRTVGILSGLATIAMSIAGALGDVSHWYLAVMAFVTALPGFDAYYRIFKRKGDQIRDRYDALIDAAAVFFWEVDMRNGAFVSVAGNLKPLVGYTPAEFLAMGWWDIVTEEDRRRLMELPTLEVGGERALVTGIRHRDGHTIVFRHHVRRVGEHWLRGVSSNINDLAEATETIRFQAEHDALTGLFNRSVLVDRLDRVTKILDADVPHDQPTAAVLMLDLNRFKEVNDTLGHPVGDRLLQILAERFVAAVPEATVVSRLGGDEFAVLLTQDVSRASALDAARRLVAATERKLEIDRVKLAVSASVGVVLAPEHGDSTDEILRHVDIAMYGAKRRGASVEVFQSTPKDYTLERLTLSSAIGTALDGGQFELWFQPKLCLESRAVVGAEALARWRHPERGVLQPADFLELISLAGEYHRFTDLVMEQGVEMTARCATAGHDIELAVNLSSLSFFDQRLPDRLAELLRRHAVSPQRFTLEITEADILDEAGSHYGVFDRLKELGVGISIDDFGTGHSSLVRLRELPVTELKLDRSFVSQLETNPQDLIIVETIVDLARALGHRTVAEGVESEDVVNILRTIGCQTAQGFLFAEPIPANDFPAFLDGWKHGTRAWPRLPADARALSET